jgi:hypothetical protein
MKRTVLRYREVAARSREIEFCRSMTGWFVAEAGPVE